MNSPIREDFITTAGNEWVIVAELKLYDARKSLQYSEYQLENARWRISYDVLSKIAGNVVLYKNSPNITLCGLPVDICDGRDVLKLYVEV